MTCAAEVTDGRCPTFEAPGTRDEDTAHFCWRETNHDRHECDCGHSWPKETE